MVHGGPVDATEVARVKGALLFEPPDRPKQLIKFATLLVLSSAIATYGLLGDSVATVVGAMIIAPLMLPIMGLAFGISIGDQKAVVDSILIGLAGIAICIGTSYILAKVSTPTFDPEASSQIISRTHPRLVDLAAAIATGLAGAFATGRKDVSDTLPGVAIAISLVPPLSNAGILIAEGWYGLALGSLLLFMTNYFAIVLTGTLVFGLMGYPWASIAGKTLRGRRKAIAIVLVMMVVVAVPLSLQSVQISREHASEGRAAEAVKAWLAGTDYKYVSATVEEGAVSIVVVGRGDLPDSEDLRAELTGRLHGLEVRLEALPSQSLGFDTD